jgi:hypothetical protein
VQWSVLWRAARYTGLIWVSYGERSVPLTWADLLIEDVTPADFGRWMSEWGDFIVGQVGPAFMSKFGTWFLRRPEGHVEMLDVFTGGVERMANSYEAFIAEVNQQWWQEVYLLSELVFRLHEVSKIPGRGQCYALAPHPALGGPNPMAGQPVDLKFVSVMEIGLWQSLCAQAVRAAL